MKVYVLRISYIVTAIVHMIRLEMGNAMSTLTKLCALVTSCVVDNHVRYWDDKVIYISLLWFSSPLRSRYYVRTFWITIVCKRIFVLLKITNTLQ